MTIQVIHSVQGQAMKNVGFTWNKKNCVSIYKHCSEWPI